MLGQKDNVFDESGQVIDESWDNVIDESLDYDIDVS